MSIVDKHGPTLGPGHHVPDLAKLARAVAHAPELRHQGTYPVDGDDPGGGPGLVPNVETTTPVESQLRDLRKRVPPLRLDPADPVHLLEIGRERTVLARRWCRRPPGVTATGGQERNENSATQSHESTSRVDAPQSD